MSTRSRRALVWLLTTAVVLALPAVASAATSLSVTPSRTQADSSPAITATLSFSPGSGDTPKTVVTSLAAGVLANLNDNPSCLRGSPQLTPSCGIGSATITTHPGGAVPGHLYLVPPQSSTDVAGIDLLTALSATPQYVGVSLNPKTPGALNLTTTFPNTEPTTQITAFTADFSDTLDGQPFTRLPSYCNGAVSTMSVTYYHATPAGSASGSFTPTGCASLVYAPVLTAAITRDAKDNGAALTLAIKDSAGEAASKSIGLQLPKGLIPNVSADLPCLSGTPCKVGTAAATSRLLPSAALANGTVTLGGSATKPTITIAFPAPFAISLTGTISLTSDSVTFATVPDVPLSALTLNITGPSGGGRAFSTDCAPARIVGTFTSYSSAVKTWSAPIAFTGCVFKPTATGSAGGLAGGHPKLRFTITHGENAAGIARVALGLPGGLSFSRSAIVTHRTCTKAAKSKKAKCSTTIVINGLGISGALAKSVSIKHGRLVIGLKKPAGSLTITLAGPLVSEGRRLQSKVKKHRRGSVRFTLRVTDANHTASTLSLRLRAH